MSTTTTTTRGASTNDLINAIADRENVTKASVKEKVGHVIDGIVDLTIAQGSLQLNGLGGFKTVQREARTGRNPRTGVAIPIPASVGLKFSPAKAFKDKANA